MRAAVRVSPADGLRKDSVGPLRRAAAFVALLAPWLLGACSAPSQGASEEATDAAAPDGDAQAAAPFSPCPPSDCGPSDTIECYEGRCLPICMTDADCPQGSKCAIPEGVSVGCNDYAYVLHCSDPATDPCTPLPESCTAPLACLVGQSGTLPSFCGRRLEEGTIHCVADEDCAEGRACRIQSSLADDPSRCEAWCRPGVSGDCAAGFTCLPMSPPLVLRGTALGTCAENCDPTQACPDGTNCLPIDAGSATVTDCLPGVSAMSCMNDIMALYCDSVTDECRTLPGGSLACEPAVCDSLSCPPGMGCRDYGGGQTGCEPLCDLASPACAGGAACVPFGTPLSIRGITYGTCEVGCDPVSSQATCGANSTCAVVNDAPGGQRTACVPAGTGAGPAGCVSSVNVSSCAQGATCATLALGAGSVDACEPYCRVGHPEDCPPSPLSVQEACVGFVPAATVGGVQYGTCQEECDLTNSSGTCGSDAECIPVDDGANPVHTACAGTPVGAGSAGTPCSDSAACGPDTTCHGQTCVAWCRTGATSHCAPGSTCMALSPALTIGAVTYGVCL